LVTDLFCGVDFGTTNSSVAVSDGSGPVRVLRLDPHNDNPTSLPSLIYISEEGEQIIGRAAANTFIERNVDREVLVRQVDLGIDIEGYVSSELDNDYGRSKADESTMQSEAVRAHALVEVNSPGRLFQSIKSSLKYRDFKGTQVYDRHYQIEELVALVLGPIKEAVDREAGRPVERAVFGRPVRFSRDDRDNDLAEDRLRRAANLAGFRDVAFFYEPVAACVEYAVATDRKQRLMVVDIGGGTCDVCIMEFGGELDVARRLSESRILSVAGVPVAGDAIDREIIRRKLFPSLGSRSRYGPSKLPMPMFVYNGILDWQSLYKMNTEETIHWLIAVESSSTQPEAIRSLRTLIQRNFGYPLVRKVEHCKKMLSTEWEAPVELHHHGMRIHERLGRSEFTEIIEDPLADMLESIEEAERLAGVRPDQIDCVLTTGGTCLIPAVQHLLSARYSPERLLQRETFTSVAAGLALVAQYV
jgi:hypothetical chaperone protein